MTDDIPSDMIPDESARLGSDPSNTIDESAESTKRIRRSGFRCEECFRLGLIAKRILEKDALGVDISVWVYRCHSCDAMYYQPETGDYSETVDIGISELAEKDDRAVESGTFSYPGSDDE